MIRSGPTALSTRLVRASIPEAASQMTGKTTRIASPGRSGAGAVAQESDRQQVQHRNDQVGAVAQPLPGGHEAGHEQQAMEDECRPCRAGLCSRDGQAKGVATAKDADNQGQRKLAQSHLGARPELPEIACHSPRRGPLSHRGLQPFLTAPIRPQ